MKKTIRLIQSYLIFALPFVVAVSLWSSYGSPASDASLLLRGLWEVASWNLILWFAVLILFLVFLVVYRPAREQTLRRIANLKERDEREEYLTGQAAKSSYVSTLSCLILLLFLSIFSVKLTRVPENMAINGNRRTLMIKVDSELLDRPRTEANAAYETLVDIRGIPLSKAGLLLIVLLWQLLSFNLSMRKMIEAEE